MGVILVFAMLARMFCLLHLITHCCRVPLKSYLLTLLILPGFVFYVKLLPFRCTLDLTHAIRLIVFAVLDRTPTFLSLVSLTPSLTHAFFRIFIYKFRGGVRGVLMNILIAEVFSWAQFLMFLCSVFT